MIGEFVPRQKLPLPVLAEAFSLAQPPLRLRDFDGFV